MYDIIIVGARCAGASTALLLSRRGFRVLLVDRATFPSDTMSGHYIQQPGVAALDRWGLLDTIRASGAPPIRQVRFDFGPAAFVAPLIDGAGSDTGYCVRRTYLDKILVDAAVAAGAELREGFSVSDLIVEDGAVVGIRGAHKGGAAVVERASLVIGADGMHSPVARMVNAQFTHATPSLTCTYYSYWSGLPLDGIEFYTREGRCIVAVPTNDDLAIINVLWPSSSFHAVRSDIEGHFMESIAMAPGLAERMKSAERVERYIGTGSTANFLRRPYGKGWALVGDAGYHRDSITAQGITDAFRDAELITDAITAGMGEGWLLDEELVAFERKRNEAIMPMYEFTCDLARLAAPPPHMQQLMGALLHNPLEAARFIGTIAGTVSIPEFMAPANIERILRESSLVEHRAA